MAAMTASKAAVRATPRIHFSSARMSMVKDLLLRLFEGHFRMFHG